MSNEERTIELFYADEDFRGELEYCQGLVFVHLTFHKKSFSAWKRMLKEFENLKDYVGDKGYEELFTYTRVPKFVQKVGAEFVTLFYFNSIEYEVWKWDLKPQP